MKTLLMLLTMAMMTCGVLALGKDARTIHLNDKKTERILVSPGKSVILSFPTHPNKVIIGNKGLFAVDFVDNDLAVSALKYPAESNIFIWLEGRRFGFDLHTTAEGGDEIILVRDATEEKVKVRIKNE